jgi:alginate O-acetyltransferase complex protein AlgF
MNKKFQLSKAAKSASAAIGRRRFNTHLLTSLTIPSAFLMGSGKNAVAQTRGGLYDPEPPADSAYVRLLSMGNHGQFDVLVDDKIHASKITAGEVSDYLVLVGGKRTIKLQASAKGQTLVQYSLDVPKGKALTLVFTAVTGNGSTTNAVPKIFEDKANTNKLKALVTAYHLDGNVGAIDVLTADGSTKVFSNLGFGSSNSIQVNPITVELIAAKLGSNTSALNSKPAALTMTQGATYSVFFLPDAQGKMIARSLQNKTERYVAKG